MASVGVTECSLNTTPVYTLYVNRMNFTFSVQWVRGLFLGVKRSGRDVNHPPPSSAEVKQRVELHLYSLSLGLHGMAMTESKYMFAIQIIYCLSNDSLICLTKPASSKSLQSTPY